MESNQAKDRLIEAVIAQGQSRNEKLINHKIDLKDWKITQLYKDTLWVKLLDEPDANNVMRNGIILAVSQAKGIYSIGEILMAGPDTKYAKVGSRVLFIKHVGQPAERTVDGYKTHFVKEDAVMAVMEYNGTDEEMKQDITDQILLGNK